MKHVVDVPRRIVKDDEVGVYATCIAAQAEAG